ncbi:MAG: TIGR03663 family protein [Herpetosiphon sp.]
MIREEIAHPVVSPAPPPARTKPPARILDHAWEVRAINVEIVLYALLFLGSIGLHLWQLGHMAMAHDESVVSYMSWKFFTGRGGFTCAGSIPDAAGVVKRTFSNDTYCYDPIYHGPTQYFLQFAAYFLFGVSDVTSRLPMALSGIALIPMCWLMRPLVGKRTAFVSAILLTFSPSLLYYSRYARHDALMVLWTMFLTIGLFRWLKSGRTGDLVLAASGLALAWATHELVFILGFIIFTFFAFRMLWEYRRRWYIMAVAVAAVAGGAVVVATIATYPASKQTAGEAYKLLQRALGPALLLGGGALLSLLMSRFWEPSSIVLDRFRVTWATRRNADPGSHPTRLGSVPDVYWWAIGAFLVLFTLLFTTFFAYPVGFFDGFYRGLQYWLGSQHDYSRGDQPWFYYFMLLPIYEILPLIFTIGGIVAWFWKRRALTEPSAASDEWSDVRQTNGGAFQSRVYSAPSQGDGLAHAVPTPIVESLWVPFTLYWAVLSFVAYTWAGEKMPWLLIHIALPLALFAASVLAELAGKVSWRDLRPRDRAAIPLLVVAMLISFFIAAYYITGGGSTLQATRAQARAIPALLFVGACAWGLWSLARRITLPVVLRVSALSLAAFLLLYQLRAISMVVYEHPDTPVEPLIYTQTAPDVIATVDRMQQIAIDVTRNERSKDDPTGGNSLKMVIDNDLAWPFQWYFRDWRNLNWTDMSKNPALPADAPAILVHTSHLNENNGSLRSQLADTHIKTSEGVFNWWFPEGGKVPDPRNPGKDIRAYKELRNDAWWQVLLWPFRPDDWPLLGRFMLYRDIPHKIEGRDYEVYVRNDLAPGGVAGAKSTPDVATVPLSVVRNEGSGQLNGPRGIVIDAKNNLYIADALNHRIVVYDNTGKQIRAFGSRGQANNQFNEPSGVAFDGAGNLYVADTWNSRVVKLKDDGTFIASWGSGTDDFGNGRRATDTKGDATKNREHPLNFYGPRNLIVLGDRVFIADTGNKRMVVTDLNGNFIEQFGTWGKDAGQFHEPIGLGKDAAGNLYVGDTWNGRVQVFAVKDGHTNPIPTRTITVRGWSKDTYNDPFITVTPDGRVVAGIPERLELAVYGPDGKLTNRIKDPQITAPHGLAIGTEGQAFVVDGNAARGQVIVFKLP